MLPELPFDPDGGPVLAVPASEVPRVAAALGRCSRRIHGGVAFLAGAGDDASVQRALRIAGVAGEPLRLYDRLWLVPPDSDDDAAGFIGQVYDALAAGYGDLVDAARTRDNIAGLLDVVLARSPRTDLPVLDLGCGPGLATTPAAERRVTLLGVDVSAAMREQARRRGERAVGPEDLARLPAASTGGAIASYLLHLVPRPAALEEAWRLLAPGAVLAANVHKGRRLAHAAAALEALGARVERPGPRAEAPQHGPLLVAVKPD